MVNKFLDREAAPISPESWQIMDQTLKEIAKTILVGRRLFPIEGPFGLGLKAISTGDVRTDENGPIVSRMLPLGLVFRTFTMSKRDFAAFERDKIFLEMREMAKAAIQAAMDEDNLLFNGAGGTAGIFTLANTVSQNISSWDEIGTAAGDLINAVTALDNAGFHGPYALALPPARYNLLLRRSPTAFISELDNVRTIATDGVFKAPSLKESGVLVATGRQFSSIILGQDMSVGFVGPQAEKLEFSISESLALFVREPGSICILR